MTTRQVTRIKVEVEFVLPVGKRPPWGVEAVRQFLSGSFDAPGDPEGVRFPSLSVRLLSKETTYL